MKQTLFLFLITIFSFCATNLFAQNPQEIIDSARAYYEKQEYELAAGLYYRLAKEGHPEGMLEVAFMLRDGVGIEKNDDKALEYFEMAAEKGYKYSFQPLAEMYEKRQMMEEAVIFYKLAAKEFPENNKKLAILYFDEENYEAALPFVKKLVKMEDGDGIFLYGVMHMEGLGVELKEKTGIKYLKKAAEMGHPAAAQYLKDLEREKLNDIEEKDDPEDYDTEFNED